jgi:hypothetical protein
MIAMVCGRILRITSELDADGSAPPLRSQLETVAPRSHRSCASCRLCRVHQRGAIYRCNKHCVGLFPVLRRIDVFRKVVQIALFLGFLQWKFWIRIKPNCARQRYNRDCGGARSAVIEHLNLMSIEVLFIAPR